MTLSFRGTKSVVGGILLFLITGVTSQTNSDYWDEATTIASPDINRGPRGPRGDIGLPGLPGFIGYKGDYGLNGIPGNPGQLGYPGIPGPKGDYDGPPGPTGPTGRPGISPRGERGNRGVAALETGAPGVAGRRGRVGRPSPEGNGSKALIVLHSLTAGVPNCMDKYPKLWHGFSLLSVEVNGEVHHQDLGLPGSCLRRFSTMPFASCDPNNNCKYSSKNDKSYWLSTDTAKPRLPVAGRVIRPHISRCVVCEAPSDPVVVHSQTVDIPECPSGYIGKWTGYSFVMNTATQGGGGGGQQLGSTGSCLEDFSVGPLHSMNGAFIECNGPQGTCHYGANKFSFWLTVVKLTEQFSRTVPEIFNYDDKSKIKVSRCQVCMKQQLF